MIKLAAQLTLREEAEVEDTLLVEAEDLVAEAAPPQALAIVPQHRMRDEERSKVTGEEEQITTDAKEGRRKWQGVCQECRHKLGVMCW